MLDTSKGVNSGPLLRRVWDEVQVTCLTHRLHTGVLLLTLILTFYQFSFYKHSTCMALLSFNNLCLLNLFRVVAHLCGLWSDSQPASINYSYGLARVRVLVVFAGLVLMIMLACWSLKVMLVVWLVGAEGEPYLGCSSSGNALLLGTEVLVLTGTISATGSGRALDSVIRATAAASPAMALLHKLAKTRLPAPLRWRVLEALGLLRRAWSGGPLCPVLVLALCCWLLLVAHSAAAALIDSLLGASSRASLMVWADAFTALTILLLTASRLRQPLLLTTRTLMQGVGGSSVAVQRSLREAGTVEGVLELRTAQIWSVTPACLLPPADRCRPGSSGEVLAGSVLVRLHRDAQASAVVRQLQLCLHHTLQYLTLQVYKDEWLQPQTSTGVTSASIPPDTLPTGNMDINSKPYKDILKDGSAGVLPMSYYSNSDAYASLSPPAVVAHATPSGQGAIANIGPPPTSSSPYSSLVAVSTPSSQWTPNVIKSAVTSTHSPHYVNINFPVVSSHSSSSPLRQSHQLCAPSDGYSAITKTFSNVFSDSPRTSLQGRNYGSTANSITTNSLSNQSQLDMFQNLNEASFLQPNGVPTTYEHGSNKPSATHGYSIGNIDNFVSPYKEQEVVDNYSKSLVENGSAVNHPLGPTLDPNVLNYELGSRQQFSYVSSLPPNAGSNSTGNSLDSRRIFNSARYCLDADDHSYVNIDYSKPLQY